MQAWQGYVSFGIGSVCLEVFHCVSGSVADAQADLGDVSCRITVIFLMLFLSDSPIELVFCQIWEDESSGEHGEDMG